MLFGGGDIGSSFTDGFISNLVGGGDGGSLFTDGSITTLNRPRVCTLLMLVVGIVE